MIASSEYYLLQMAGYKSYFSLAVFIFPPNCPISVYGRKNIPDIYDAVWVPRKVPRNNYSDWQATSQLIFLTKQQELMCFVSDADEEILGASMAHLQGLQALPQTPFGAMLAQQQKAGHSQQGTLMNGSVGALLLKKSTAKEVSSALGIREGYCVCVCGWFQKNVQLNGRMLIMNL